MAVRARGLLLAGLLYLPMLPLSGGSAEAAEYAIGADLSFLMSAEENGTVFKGDGRAERFTGPGGLTEWTQSRKDLCADHLGCTSPRENV
ncbi:MAG: hypothetical protein JW793_03380 [Acidobacteria bacterium]|nr:hypothetical protein [Acidobacteriota bacterium]